MRPPKFIPFPSRFPHGGPLTRNTFANPEPPRAGANPQATDIRTQVNSMLKDECPDIQRFLGTTRDDLRSQIRASAVVLKVAGSLPAASEHECEAAFQALKEEGVWCTENQRTLSGTAGAALNHLLELDNGWFRQTLTERARSDSAREVTVNREMPYLGGCTFMVSGVAGGGGQRTMSLNLFGHTPVYDPVLCPALASEVAFGCTHGNALLLATLAVMSGHLSIGDEAAFHKMQTTYCDGDMASFMAQVPVALKSGPAMGRMVLTGDILADRRQNDFATLSVLDCMNKLGVHYEILLGNHELAALEACSSVTQGRLQEGAWAAAAGGNAVSLPGVDCEDTDDMVFVNADTVTTSVTKDKELYGMLMRRNVFSHLHMVLPGIGDQTGHSHASLSGGALTQRLSQMAKLAPEYKFPPQPESDQPKAQLAWLDSSFRAMMFSPDGELREDNLHKLISGAGEDLTLRSSGAGAASGDMVWPAPKQLLYRQPGFPGGADLTSIPPHGHTEAMSAGGEYVPPEGQGGKGKIQGCFERNVYVGAELEPARTRELLMDAVWNRDVATIRGLEPYLLSLPPEQRVDVLYHAGSNGATALLIAMQEGHADTVTAFGRLLTVLTTEERVGVFIRPRNDGATALLMAMQNGHAGAVTAFGRLLVEFSQVQRMTVLGTAVNGISPLLMAMWNGRADAVTAFGRLLTELLPEQRTLRVRMLNYSRDGTPPLFIAMQEGHAGAVVAFGSLLTVLSQEEIVGVLNHVGSNGATALFMAMQNGRADAVVAFGSLLTRLSPAQIVDVLNHAGSNGATALLMAMQNGHAGAVTAFGRLLTRLSPEQREDVLNHAGSNGATPLLIAMQNGHAGAVRAWRTALASRDTHVSGSTAPDTGGKPAPDAPFLPGDR